jgi:diaminopimelate decarboxylase
MWWEREGLEIRDGRLSIAGHDAEEIAREHGTPVYVADAERVADRAQALHGALEGAGLRGVVRLALKAQREPELLRFLRGRVPFLGMDVCSPGEVRWAMEHGWRPSEISYTGTNVSERDLDVILEAGVHVNVDLLTQIDRVGRRRRGGAIGLRVNPRIGAGGVDTLYSGIRPTKFGVFAEQIPEALERARSHGLEVDTVHVHVGDGYLDDGLPRFEEAVRRTAAMTGELLAAGCPIAEVNVGGGLGVPQREGERPLDLAAWAAMLAEHLGPFDVTVATEPGDFLAKDGVVHLAEVVSVEDREGVRFVGLDTGWSAMGEHFIYGSPVDFVLCRDANGGPEARVTFAGNINEGDDLFAEDFPFPAVAEGDVVAALNVGSYNASIASEHCLRPPARTLVLQRT